jgi:7-carboxy-7-deazaguanine synthase
VLTIHEIYRSIQGESTRVGQPCAFVRLTACDLRCRWCDTPEAFTGGRKMAVDDVVAEVARLGCRLVEVTGGEPLLQPEVNPLMQRLLEAGHEVLLETGGHLPVDEVPEGVVVVLDVKCPGSGEAERVHWPNLTHLRPAAEVKFVIAGRDDFDYAADVVARHGLVDRAAAVLFSPVHGELASADLAGWILESGLDVRLQLQAHKYVWSADARGV